MEKRKSLGKGLANLLPEITSIQDGVISEYQYIDVDSIIPNPDQPRKKINELELEGLAETIKNVGIIEPIIVRKKDEGYVIISGERRWRAAKMAGFKKIPAIIKNDLDEIKSLEMAIIENIQREDLTPIEEAKAYEKLIELTKWNIKQVAEKVGKDRSTVSNLLRLLKLPEEIQDLVNEKKITAGQVRPLLSIADKKMMIQLAQKIINEDWSARKVEEEVAKLTDPKNKRSKKENFKDPTLIKIESKLRAKFTTKVEIQHQNSGSGKIVIHYANLDEFDRILELLGIPYSDF
ncbi:MAG: ParB/RepB/Spo0J family partition protein [Leptospiraceae bacterium]|nr:ParB/RepB/Spo0J family partition protein [Leptospiraceae bacterium]MDW7976210.1 ParB/RepB/Spo0J family partition protein [Leptospiraceae bacterium]